MKVTISPSMLASAKTEAGGYTRAQLEVLGVTWPPTKGWPSALIGKEVEQEIWDRFLNARLELSKVRKQQFQQGDLF